MVRFYLGTPKNQMQAHAASQSRLPVLVSFGATAPWLDKHWMSSFDRVLLDSGSFSELNSGKVIDGEAYSDWAREREPWVDAWAGIDDIRGDWRRSLSNYEKFGGFPTFHDTDPVELLDDIIALALSGQRWIGIGMLPPRAGREDWLRRTLDRVPDGIHVHGWACGQYAHINRIDSVDSTNWWRDSFLITKNPMTSHLTPGEALDIVVKRYQRRGRTKATHTDQTTLFE